MTKKKSEVKFEQNMRELERLVEKMEQGELSLEESLRCFERGVALTRACQQALSEAEQKVKLLQDDGELTDFPDPDDEEVFSSSPSLPPPDFPDPDEED